MKEKTKKSRSESKGSGKQKKRALLGYTADTGQMLSQSKVNLGANKQICLQALKGLYLAGISNSDNFIVLQKIFKLKPEQSAQYFLTYQYIGGGNGHCTSFISF